MTDAPSSAKLLRAPQGLLRAYNDQAAVECVGYAADGALLVLLDVVGHKTACKSIWATLVSSPRKSLSISGGVTLSGGDAKRDRYQAFWTELPEHNAHNLLVCHARLLDATTDPNDIRPFFLAGSQHEAMDGDATSRMLMQRFAALLNQALDLPILPAWADALWLAGLRAGLIDELAKGGDMASAYRVQPDGERWAEVIRNAFEAGDIHMPDAPASEERR